MTYLVKSVAQFREQHFKSNAEFCRAIGVNPQQYKEYLPHFVLIDELNKEKPILILKGKTVNMP